MAKSAGDEPKTEIARIRMKPSLRAEIRRLQAESDFQDLPEQDFLAFLVRRGLKEMETEQKKRVGGGP